MRSPHLISVIVSLSTIIGFPSSKGIGPHSNKDREVLSREQALIEKEQHLASLLNHKDQEIASLHHLVSQLQQSHQPSQQEIEMSIKQAVIRREEELRSVRGCLSETMPAARLPQQAKWCLQSRWQWRRCGGNWRISDHWRDGTKGRSRRTLTLGEIQGCQWRSEGKSLHTITLQVSSFHSIQNGRNFRVLSLPSWYKEKIKEIYL